jgi:hypothetical protein
MWSVNFDVSISRKYQTLGGHSSRPSEDLGVPRPMLGAMMTILGETGSAGNKPESIGDMSGSTSNYSRAGWEKQLLLCEHCWWAWKS